MIPRPYENLLQEILTEGNLKSDRTGTGTRSLFKKQLRYDISESFPLITTKKIHFKSVALELLWFLRGDSNIRWLKDQGVTIWDEWADDDGELGPVYGVQWRSWLTPDGEHIDQIANVMESLRTDPDSRRHVVSAWNVSELHKMKLPPCHLGFQFYVADGKLSCGVTQRSADMFLGVPFNIASYSLLTYMVAQQLDLKPHELIWEGGDCHIYLNHIEKVEEQIHGRYVYPYPKLKILRKPKDIFSYNFDDFELVDYLPHGPIKAPIAI